MKTFGALFVLALVALTAAHDRGCRYVLGQCYEECPEGTHSYSAGYNKPWHFEPTCEDQHPEEQNVHIADYSACYCDPPTVKDTHSGKCVTVDKCPK